MIDFLEERGVPAAHLKRAELNSVLGDHLRSGGGTVVDGQPDLSQQPQQEPPVPSRPAPSRPDPAKKKSPGMDEAGATSLKSPAADTPWTAASTWLNMRLPPALAANGAAALGIRSSTAGSAEKEPQLEALCRPFGIAVGHSVSGEGLVKMMVQDDPLKLIDLLSTIAHDEWEWPAMTSSSIHHQKFNLIQFERILKNSDGKWLSKTDVTQRATSKICCLDEICADDAAAVVHFLADCCSLEAAQDLIDTCQQAADGESYIKVQNGTKVRRPISEAVTENHNPPDFPICL
jgi:hypothetical protein